MFRSTGAPALFASVTNRLEAAAFRRCDRIVCNTREFAEALRARTFGRVSWVPNGIDLEELPEVRAPDPGPPVLAYVGTLYFNRDLGPVIEALARLRRAGDCPPGLKLRFAGHADAAHTAELAAQIGRSALDERQVEVLGPLSREEAQDVLLGAHLCLVLAQRQPMQVPAKLYEAVGLGLQTLVIAEAGSAAHREAERVGALCRAPSDTEGIASIIRHLRDGTIPPRVDTPSAVDYRRIAREYGDLMAATAP